MEIYKAIIMGAVQGITEFLPLSSSGHLAVAEYFLGTDGGLSFGVFMHLATLIPVLFVFKNEKCILFTLINFKTHMIIRVDKSSFSSYNYYMVIVVYEH